jgi:hypothetical protein
MGITVVVHQVHSLGGTIIVRMKKAMMLQMINLDLQLCAWSAIDAY